MVTEMIQTILLFVLGYIGWLFLQNYNQQKKEKQKDDATIKKISERYKSADISAPVNDLVERLRNNQNR